MHQATTAGRRPNLAALVVLVVACGPGPLPPEAPSQGPNDRAPFVEIGIESSAATPTVPAAEPEPTTSRTYDAGLGFAQPESVLFDRHRDLYWVSNINGAPDAHDNNGFISRLDPDGDQHALTWVRGGERGAELNAPKGMALSPDGRELAVADIDTVRFFDSETGQALRAIPLAGATFLNDVSYGAPDILYVSDSALRLGPDGATPQGVPGIYRIGPEGPAKLSPDVPEDGLTIGHPNGVLWLEGTLLAVTFRGNAIHQLGPLGESLYARTLPAGGLDGLVALGADDFLVSSWDARAVFRGGMSTGFRPVLTDIDGPADIGFDTRRKRVLIPSLPTNRVQARALPQQAPGGDRE